MDVESKLKLLKRNTQEIVTEDELRKLLKTKNKPVVYLGTAITNSPHIGYFVWALKLADFLKCGFKVKVLLADVHGALDNTPWELLEYRYKYYKEVINLIFKAIGVKTSQLEFVKGSSFQLKKDYIFDVLKLTTYTTIHDAQRAASEVIKFGDNPKLSGVLYPLMQSLDEEYLKVDIQYGGVDQRKILMFARENLPKLGYKPRIEFMTPLIPGLIGKKMSSSDLKSKVDLLDPKEEVTNKVLNAFCPAGILEDNGILTFLKHVIMPIKNDKKELFLIERDEKFGGNLKFKKYEDIEELFMQKKLHPQDLKKSVAREINKLLKVYNPKREQLNKLAKKAFPK